MPATRGTSFEHRNGHECTDPEFHRHCAGRWRGSVSLGFDADGKRIRRRVTGPHEDGGPGGQGRAALAEIAGIALGSGESKRDRALYQQMAELCMAAGADRRADRWVPVRCRAKIWPGARYGDAARGLTGEKLRMRRRLAVRSALAHGLAFGGLGVEVAGVLRSWSRDFMVGQMGGVS